MEARLMTAIPSAPATPTPRVSVVIPTYNRAALLPRAVDSALSAIEVGDEIIVVDDGSTDATAEVLAPYGDRIRYIRTENRGAGAARNRGLREARQPLVAFLDSDDSWYPDHLALQRTLMTRFPDLVLTFSDFSLRDVDDSVHLHYLRHWNQCGRDWRQILGTSESYAALLPLPPSREDFSVYFGSMYLPLLEGGCVPSITAVARRDVAVESLRFEEGVATYEDWFGFARLARRGRSAFLGTDTAWNHGHLGPRITSSVNAYQAISTRIALIERVWGTDAAFLAAHRGLYESILAEQYRLRARWFLVRGRMAECRADLRRAGPRAWMDRMVAALPGPAIVGLTRARRALLALLHLG
jgi:glycosyltransferase involved in cell wall biosynthesis